jgi:hypothetical protein
VSEVLKVGLARAGTVIKHQADYDLIIRQNETRGQTGEDPYLSNLYE